MNHVANTSFVRLDSLSGKTTYHAEATTSLALQEGHILDDKGRLVDEAVDKQEHHYRAYLWNASQNIMAGQEFDESTRQAEHISELAH